MRTRPLLALVAVALLAACTDGASVTSGTSNENGTRTPAGDTSPDGSTSGTSGGNGGSTPGEVTGTIDWQDFGDSGRLQTGNLVVPVDYDDPSKGTFDLYLARHLADPDQRIGSLLVNPGGPGFGGSDFALQADLVYSEALLSHFDIIGWDPRGTGLSTPAIDCIDDYDHFYTGVDITPDDAKERQHAIDIAKEFADDCMAKNADLFPYVGTNDSARDMDAIRRALGEEKISYFGFSYGSELGATWATLFPDTVRAAVLDGAADPNADGTESGVQQSAGFELALDNFLKDCNARSDCAFHNDGHADTAFDELMASIDDRPLPTVSGRPDLTRGMALNGVAQALYSRASWGELADALRQAQKGKGEGLLALFDQYFERDADGNYPNLLEAFQVISCADDPTRLTVAQDDATAPEYVKVAPRMAPATIGSYFCTFFPPAADPMVTVTGKGAGPILVMGTTGDPATPLESTKKMAAALEDGRLVVVDAEGHTGYRANQCSQDVIDEYLIDPAGHAPKDGTRCG